MTGGERCLPSGGGLVVENNDRIRSFLLNVTNDLSSSDFTEESRRLASEIISQKSLRYRDLRAIWSSHPSSKRPALSELLYGTTFVFSSPKPREKVCSRLRLIIVFFLLGVCLFVFEINLGDLGSERGTEGKVEETARFGR